ncbi:O-antigen ligase family protein [Prevotella sp. lc2012]|uniref:O-antigen ligase family protein n=1 Tax=Prevotella sp. lc2012 TaxID=1761886 RepID=UPI00089B6CC0|nr:O-antigen ligase family protein [Prevotella sp. lc2012]SEE38035.1 O-antigen ligase like membrane protein [Prevotella sp. lc2012]
MNDKKKTSQDILAWTIRLFLYLMLIILPFAPHLLDISGEGEKAMGLSLLVFLSPLAILTAIHFFSRFNCIHITKLDICVFLLICYILLQSLFLHHLTGQHIILGGLLLLYAIIRSLGAESIKQLTTILVICAVVQACYGLLQLFGVAKSQSSLFNITGSFYNPGPLGGYLAMIFAIPLTSIIRDGNLLDAHQQSWKKTIYYFGVIVTATAIICSQSRAAYVSILLTCLILFYPAIRDYIVKLTKTKKYLLYGTGVLVVLILSVCIFKYKTVSAFSRLYIWGITASILDKSNIWFGVGYNHFNPAYMNAQEMYFRNNPMSGYSDYADNIAFCLNEPLQALVELGIIGSLILLTIIYFIWTVRSGSNRFLLQIKLCLFSILVFSCFSYPFHTIIITLNMCICLAFISTLSAKDNRHIILSFKLNKIGRLISGILFLSLSIITACYANELASSLKDWGKANYYYHDYRYKEAIPHYKKANAFFSTDGNFLNNYGKALSLAQRYEESNTILHQATQHTITSFSYTTMGQNYEMLGDMALAETYYWKAHWLVPSKDYPLYLLFKLYDKEGDSTKVVDMGYRILHKKQKVPSIASEQIRKDITNIINKYQ